MLFDLINNKKRRRESNVFFGQSLGSSSGGAIIITPPKIPNLSVWYKNDMSIVANIFRFNDELNVNGVQGSCSLSVPNREVQQLNGLNVLNYVTSTAVQWITQINNPYNEIFLQKWTFGGILKQSSNTAGRCCHFLKGNYLGSATSNYFVQGVSGNKLTYNVRTDNLQSAVVHSVTDWNGAGWQIVFVSYDDVTKTLTMYENGNIISSTNVLMDFMNYSVNRIYGFQNNGLATIGGWWIGGLGEFFYYSDVKNVSVINGLGKYLSKRYALPWVPC